jgi:6-phosphogluconolactonase
MRRVILLSAIATAALIAAPAIARSAPQKGRPAAAAAKPAAARPNAPGPVSTVYFGARAEGFGGGVTAARFDSRTGEIRIMGLAAETNRTTWISANPGAGLLYAGSEFDNDGKSLSNIYVLRPDPATGALTQVGAAPSGGKGATNLFYSAANRSLFVANYASGQVAVVPVEANGLLGQFTSVQDQVGSGPHFRQKSAHAHSVALDATGRFLISPDLGNDKVYVYRFDRATRTITPAAQPFVEFEPGSGPRHVVIHPNNRFVYVNTELNGGLAIFALDAGTGALTLVRKLSTFAADFTKTKSGGEIGLSPDGRFLYATNRNEDTVSVYRVDPATGDLAEVQRIDAGGKQPWAFSFDPTGKWFLLADQASDTVAVFARDPASGKLTATANKAIVPAPSSIAILSR